MSDEYKHEALECDEEDVHDAPLHELASSTASHKGELIFPFHTFPSCAGSLKSLNICVTFTNTKKPLKMIYLPKSINGKDFSLQRRRSELDELLHRSLLAQAIFTQSK